MCMLDLNIIEVDNGFIVRQLKIGTVIGQVSKYVDVGIASTPEDLTKFIVKLQDKEVTSAKQTS